jgi:hypothetical protein
MSALARSPNDTDLQWACGLADHAGNSEVEQALVIVVRELRRTQVRLAAIRATHEQGAVTTIKGRVIHASIHGREMDRLLNGETE